MNRTKKETIFSLSIYFIVASGGFFLASFFFDALNRFLLEDEDIIKPPKKELVIPEQKNSSVISNQKPTPQLSEEPKLEIPSSLPQLSGIFYDPSCSYVIIDNRILKKDDCIRGYCVKNIFSDKVEIQYKDKIFELKIK